MAHPESPTASDGRSGDPAVADVLARVSGELATLTWLAEEVQALAAPVAASGALSPDQLRGLQHLDLITQTLSDLVRATRHLARHAPPDRVNGQRFGCEIVLTDLRRRLIAGTGEPPQAQGSGNVALF